VPWWFFLAWVEKLPAWLGIEPTTLDLWCQSSAFDLSATAISLTCVWFLWDVYDKITQNLEVRVFVTLFKPMRRYKNTMMDKTTIILIYIYINPYRLSLMRGLGGSHWYYIHTLSLPAQAAGKICTVVNLGFELVRPSWVSCC